MFAVTHQYKWSDLNSLGVRETLFKQLPGTNIEERDEVKRFRQSIESEQFVFDANTWIKD